MKKAFLLTGVAVTSLAVALVIKVPVSVVWQQLDKNGWTPESLQLQGVQGTLWSGSAEGVYIDGRQLPALRWDLAPVSLLDGNIGYDVQVGHVRSGLSSRGYIELGQNEIAVEAMTGRVSLPYLQPWMDFPVPVSLQGQGRIAIDKLRIVDGQCETLDGDGHLQGVIAESSFGVLDLGRGDFTLDCSGRKIDGNLSQKSSQLVSSFKFSLKNFSAYSLDGRVEPQPELNKSFRDGLGFIGERDQRGGYQVSWRGRI